MGRLLERSSGPKLAAVAAIALAVHPGLALPRNEIFHARYNRAPTSEWSGMLSERLKRENLDLRCGANAFDLRSLDRKKSGLEPQRIFALGPRSAAALQADIEQSRKILERALSGRDLHHIMTQEAALAVHHNATAAKALAVAPTPPTILDSSGSGPGGPGPIAVAARGITSGLGLAETTASATIGHAQPHAEREMTQTHPAAAERTVHGLRPQTSRRRWVLCSELAVGGAGLAVYWGFAAWKYWVGRHEAKARRLSWSSSTWKGLFPAKEWPRVVVSWWWRGAGREADKSAQEETSFISMLASGLDYIYMRYYYVGILALLVMP
jgi:hypothetical protein